MIFFGDPDPAGGDDPNQVLWVKGLPGEIKLGKEFQNRLKGLLGWDALCKNCGKQVGSRYMSCPPHVVSGVGECCKLTFRRDSYPGGKTGPVDFGVIPLGDRQMLEDGGLIAAAPAAAAGNQAVPQLDLSEVEVRCRHCEAVLCSASTLRLDGTDAVLPARDAGDRVRFETHSKPEKQKKGFRKSICTACDHDLGNEKKGRVQLKLREPAKVILVSADGQRVSREDWMQLSRSAPAKQQGRQGRRAGRAPKNDRSATLPAAAPRPAVPVRDEAAERALTEPIPMAQAFEASAVRLHVFPRSDII
eukprot:SAG22_NODE_123_length_18914_cov_28.993410_2_plen_304_part_00